MWYMDEHWSLWGSPLFVSLSNIRTNNILRLLNISNECLSYIAPENTENNPCNIFFWHILFALVFMHLADNWLCYTTTQMCNNSPVSASIKLKKKLKKNGHTA